ncbi:MAG: heavy metal-binding domain-containing protein [Elusimicrobiales bacterium]
MKKTLLTIILAAPLLAGAAYAQKGHEGHDHSKPAAAKAAEAKPGKEAPVPRKVTAEEIGKEAACAVTGEKFKVAEDTISMSYKGHVYYFCCAGCDKSFAKTPEKYAAKKTAPNKVYVCPMGDYEGAKPGKCPKCGMKLEEKKASSGKKYACPMNCAEADKPGRCPKCGMQMKEILGKKPAEKK